MNSFFKNLLGLFFSWAQVVSLDPWLGILHWMADILKFTLLGDGLFCIPINIIELCSGICAELVYFRLLNWTRAVSNRDDFTPLWSIWLLCPVPCELWGFLLCVEVIGTIPGPVWVPWISPSNTSIGYFSGSGFLTCAEHFSAEYLRETIYITLQFSLCNSPFCTLSYEFCPFCLLTLSAPSHQLRSLPGSGLTLPSLHCCLRTLSR